MWLTIVDRRRQRLFFCLLVAVLLIPISLTCAKAQEHGQWIVADRLLAHARETRHPKRQSSSSDSGASPILEEVFFIDDSNGWIVGDGNRVANTKDGGKTWTFSLLGSPANLRGVFFSSERKGWVVGDSEGYGVVFATRDGGVSWQLQRKVEGFALSGIHKIWFANGKHGWAVGEAQKDGIVQGIILATHNGGRDWQVQYLCEDRCGALSAVKFANSLRGWAVGDGLILHTDDGGLNWREQFYDSSRYLFALDMVTPNEGWAAGSHGLLLHTSNGGETWESRSLPAERRDLWLSSVKFVNSFRGWASGDKGAIFSTTDGGKRWKLETIGASTFLRGLASTSNRIFAVGNNGIILRRWF